MRPRSLRLVLAPDETAVVGDERPTEQSILMDAVRDLERHARRLQQYAEGSEFTLLVLQCVRLLQRAADRRGSRPK
jgi:hypothetical protein